MGLLFILCRSAGIGYYSGWPDHYYYGCNDDCSDHQHNRFSPAGCKFAPILYYIITTDYRHFTKILYSSPKTFIVVSRIVIVRNRFTINSYLNFTRHPWASLILYMEPISCNRCCIQIYADASFNTENIFTIVLLLLCSQLVSGIITQKRVAYVVYRYALP